MRLRVFLVNTDIAGWQIAMRHSTARRLRRQRLGGRLSRIQDGPPNGLEVNPRGQGPRGYGSAAHGLPACESRDAGRAPPCRF